MITSLVCLRKKKKEWVYVYLELRELSFSPPVVSLEFLSFVDIRDFFLPRRLNFCKVRERERDFRVTYSKSDLYRRLRETIVSLITIFSFPLPFIFMLNESLQFLIFPVCSSHSFCSSSFFCFRQYEYTLLTCCSLESSPSFFFFFVFSFSRSFAWRRFPFTEFRRTCSFDQTKQSCLWRSSWEKKRRFCRAKSEPGYTRNFNITHTLIIIIFIPDVLYFWFFDEERRNKSMILSFISLSLFLTRH